jgi:hypothetical protein
MRDCEIVDALQEPEKTGCRFAAGLPVHGPDARPLLELASFRASRVFGGNTQHAEGSRQSSSVTMREQSW